MYAKLIKDNFVKLTTMAAIGTAAASLTLVSTVPPSFAAPPPQCVQITNQTSRSITVTNNCRDQQRVKVIIDTGRDSACTVLNPGQAFRFTWGFFSRFNRVDRC
jgi:uncharacterized lipoprotein YajG